MWRFALERRGMKVSRSKTEYMCVNEREGSGTVRLQGEEVKKVQKFKYLGSTVQSNGECGKEVKKRVQAVQGAGLYCGTGLGLGRTCERSLNGASCLNNREEGARVDSVALNTPDLTKQNPAGAGPSLDATGAGTISMCLGVGRRRETSGKELA
ncbi:hypothetical protein QTP86_004329 [Hemibagrus guttatus]|nr:hypothetical protein QTP86_004329 [Hemibagrus guttatus]